MDDDLNMILIEGKRHLLNFSFESDSIEGNSSKIFDKMPYHPFILKMKIHVLCILTNQPFIILYVMSSWGLNMKGKGIAHHIINNSTEIIHMYCNEKVDRSDYFRVGLSQFMSGTRRKISE